MKNKVVLITGGSSGIGEALAYKFSKENFNVVITGTNEHRIKKVLSNIKKNGVSQKEMLKTFNCGVGFCLIVKKNNFHKILKFFSKQYRPYIIGEIIKNKSKVKYTNNIRW